MLAFVATYTLMNLKEPPAGPVFLNNNDVVAGMFYKWSRPVAPEIWSNGRWLELPPQAKGIAGLNNRDEVAIYGREGWGIWSHGGLNLCRAPKSPTVNPPRGEPVGIDDQGHILGAEDGVEGLFRISSWPPRSERDYGLPRPVILGPDGTWVGVHPSGRMLPRRDKPTTFFIDHGKQVAIGTGGMIIAAAAISASHIVVGTYMTWSDTPAHWRRPFVWKDGTLTTLPLPNGAREGQAKSVNVNGDVVGEVDNRAVLWSKGKITYLDDLVSPGTSFEFGEAFAINDHGDILASASPKATHWPSTLMLLKANRSQA